MSFGIALAGGGTRGAAHVGVLLALTEEGLIPTAIAGTSAGGIVAGLYACGISPAQLCQLVNHLAEKPGMFIDPACCGVLKAAWELLTRRTLSLSGLIKGKRMERFLHEQTGGRALRDVDMRLVIPSVDVATGNTIVYTNTLAGTQPVRHTVWRTDALVCEAMRASAAFPAVFQPVLRDDMVLVDGGVADNLPVDLLLATGERKVLAIDVSEAYEAPCQNNLIEIASHSLTIMGSRLKEQIATGEQYRLCPALPGEAGLLTFEHMTSCMQAGYDAVRRQLPLLRSLFA